MATPSQRSKLPVTSVLIQVTIIKVIWSEKWLTIQEEKSLPSKADPIIFLYTTRQGRVEHNLYLVLYVVEDLNMERDNSHSM